MSAAVDRDELARVLHDRRCASRFHGKCWMGVSEADADAILSSGVLLDAAEVRAQALDAAADACQAEAKEAHEAGPEYDTLGRALRAQARWLRNRAASERDRETT